MSRKYTFPLTGLAMTAAGEMIALTGIANKFCRVRRIKIKVVNQTPPAAQMLQFKGQLYTTTAGGTGGSAVVAQQVDQGDTTANTTALLKNAVPNSGTTGNFRAPWVDGCYVLQGLDTDIPGDGIAMAGAVIWVLTLVQAPLGAVSISFDGFVQTEEEG